MPRTANNPDPRTAYQRGRITEALADGALTARQLAARLHMSLSGVLIHLAGVRSSKPRQVRIAGYLPNPNSQRPAPKYGLGSNAGAKFKKSRTPKRRIAAEDRKASIPKLLGDRQMTAAELVKAMLLERARIYVIEMHAAGAVHVRSGSRIRREPIVRRCTPPAQASMQSAQSRRPSTRNARVTGRS